MRNFQNNRRWSDIFLAWPSLALLGVFLLFFVVVVFRFLGKMQVTIENRKLVEDKVAELESQKLKLSSDIGKLKTVEGQEESIRDKFGLAKEGEGLIVVVEDKNAKLTEPDSSSGFFSFFKNWFK